MVFLVNTKVRMKFCRILDQIISHNRILPHFVMISPLVEMAFVLLTRRTKNPPFTTHRDSRTSLEGKSKRRSYGGSSDASLDRARLGDVSLIGQEHFISTKTKGRNGR